MSIVADIDLQRCRAVLDGTDTVMVCMVDMQGRLMGKRYRTDAFLRSGHRESHFCNYLLATDLEMQTPDGFRSSGWSQGYGDHVVRPDLATLRRVTWLDDTGIVLCDVYERDGVTPVSHCPRRMLKGQIERARSLGFDVISATELEFVLFAGTQGENHARHFRELAPLSLYNQDYNLLHTSANEGVMRKVRNALADMGIPVTGSKGEAEAGQQELNIHHGGVLECAD